MGNLIKGLKVAAYVAEIIVAGSVVIELAEKYSGKFGKKKIATGEVKAVDAATAFVKSLWRAMNFCSKAGSIF